MDIDAKFDAEPTKVTSDLADLISKLSQVIQDTSAMGTIEIVLAEVLNNITEHAYEDRGYGAINTRISVAPDSMFVTLVDYGKPMPGLSLPEGKQADLNVALDDLPEGGFGWFMIRELTQDLHYGRQNDQNHLTFRIPLQTSDRIQNA